MIIIGQEDIDAVRRAHANGGMEDAVAEGKRR